MTRTLALASLLLGTACDDYVLPDEVLNRSGSAGSVDASPELLAILDLLPGDPVNGQVVFETKGGCIGCHHRPGAPVKTLGADIAERYASLPDADERNLRFASAIRDGLGVMIAYTGPDQDVADVITYVEQTWGP